MHAIHGKQCPTYMTKGVWGRNFFRDVRAQPCKQIIKYVNAKYIKISI